nr:hypothetical protein [Micromonospora sp. DSM 115978]
MPPLTRGYATRAKLLRASGLDVDPSVRCVSTARFYTDHLQLGHGVFVGHEVRVFGGAGARVRLGDNAAIGPGAILLAGTHDIGPSSGRTGPGRGTAIDIGAGTWVGARAVVV